MAPTERALKRLLLVEDDPGDVTLARECLMGMRDPIHMDVVEDGVAALAYLRQEAGYRNSMRPDLVVLDLNIPKRDGRMVLKEIKEDDGLRSIPVVVLTTSKSDEDIRTAYYLGSNCYIAKPSGLLEYEAVMRKVGEFWLNTARLPEA
jgi:CheY-like chemotaxis protein